MSISSQFILFEKCALDVTFLICNYMERITKIRQTSFLTSCVVRNLKLLIQYTVDLTEIIVMGFAVQLLIWTDRNDQVMNLSWSPTIKLDQRRILSTYICSFIIAYSPCLLLYNVYTVSSVSLIIWRGRHSRDRMVVPLTTTYTISAHHHWCEFEFRSGRGVQHYVI